MAISEGIAPTEAHVPFDMADAATVLIDAAGTIVGWTTAAEGLLGYPAAEVMKRPASILLASADDAAKAAVIAEQCRVHGSWGGLQEIRHRDGRRVEVGLRISSMREPGGDVCWLVSGIGMGAAATMGRPRTAVHTLADMDLPPEELLAHLDDLVIRLTEETGQEGVAAAVLGATCLCAVYDPVTRRCTLARAGHPTPAIVDPGGEVTFPPLPAGPPLGLGSLPFESAELELPAGSLIALYTDGLIETCDQDIDVGLGRLSNALGQPGLPLEELCSTVVDTLLASPQSDDVALLLARTHTLGAGHVVSWDLPCDPAVVAGARSLAVGQLTVWGLDDMVMTTELIVSELVTNAIRHGTGPIRLRLIRHEVLSCEVADASSTSPRLRHARTTDEGGRWLFLVAQMTRRWGTRYTEGGKLIWAEQDLPAPA